MVYFGRTDDQLTWGMAGSSFNVEGIYDITSTSSRGGGQLEYTSGVVDSLFARNGVVGCWLV